LKRKRTSETEEQRSNFHEEHELILSQTSSRKFSGSQMAVLVFVENIPCS